MDESSNHGRTPSTRGRRWWMLLPALLLAVPVAGSQERIATIRVGTPPASIEIVRCHFDEHIALR